MQQKLIQFLLVWSRVTGREHALLTYLIGVEIKRSTTRSLGMRLKLTSQRWRSPKHWHHSQRWAWHCKTLLAMDSSVHMVETSQWIRSTRPCCAANLACYSSMHPTTAPTHTLQSTTTQPTSTQPSLAWSMQSAFSQLIPLLMLKSRFPWYFLLSLFATVP